MSSNWPVVTIDDIKAEGKGSIAIGPFGSRMKSDCYVDKGIPVIRGTNITGGPNFKGNFVYITKEKADSLGSSNVYKNDLVFPHRGSIGEVGIILADKRYVLSSSLMKLTCNMNKVNPVFLYYFFKSRIGRHELLKNASQVGTPGIGQPLTSLKGIEFRLPPLDKQNEIGDILSSLDEKIELNTQTNQTLEQIAQALFKSWFVDFDPIKAKIKTLEAGGSADDAELAAMRVISAKTLDELNSLKTSNPEAFNKLAQTAALFPAAMQDSELGEIPEGWEASEIGSEITVVGGGTPSTKNTDFWEDGTIHWTTPKDMSGLSSKVLTRTDRKITDLGLKKISSGLLPENTVLMSSRAPVGYLALAKIPVAINQGYIAMKCEARLSPEYVLLWCEQNMEEIKQRAGGTTFAEISKSNFKPIPVIVPDNSIIDAFSAQVSRIYNLVHNNILQSQSLSAARDLLLPKLLLGEITDFFKDSE